MFWIGGKHTVIEALKNSKRIIKEIIVLDEEKKNFLQKFSKFNNIRTNNIKFFKKTFSEDISHQGFAAYVKELDKNNISIDLKKNYLENNIIVLDDITDPRNIGSIIRSAVAFNIKALIIKQRGFNNKSHSMYKAASGCMEKIKIYEVSNLVTTLNELKKYNYFITGLDSNTNSIFDKNTKFFPKNVFVFGSEEYGMRVLTKKICDQIIKINIGNEVESINVSNSVASFLSLYRFVHE